jgi:hypothetical protein
MKLMDALKPADDAPLTPLSEGASVKHTKTAWRTTEAAFRAAEAGVRALNKIGATGDRIARVEAQQALPKAEG